MSEKQSNAIGDVVRAFAASDYLAGLSFGFTFASQLLPDRDWQQKRLFRRYSLNCLAKSVIQFDRSITGDARGISRALPEVNG